MSVNEYDIGDRVTLQATFSDEDGIPTNPGTVVCKVKDPAGATATPSATEYATGVWRAQVDLDQEGTWYYRFEGTTPVVAAGEGQLYTKPTQFP